MRDRDGCATNPIPPAQPTDLSKRGVFPQAAGRQCSGALCRPAPEPRSRAAIPAPSLSASANDDSPDGTLGGVVAATVLPHHSREVFKIWRGPNKHHHEGRTDGTVADGWPFDEAIHRQEHLRPAKIVKRLNRLRAADNASKKTNRHHHDGVHRDHVTSRRSDCPDLPQHRPAAQRYHMPPSAHRRCMDHCGFLSRLLRRCPGAGLFPCCADHTAHSAAEQNIAMLASTEDWTGLSNRWYDETIRARWRRARRDHATTHPDDRRRTNSKSTTDTSRPIKAGPKLTQRSYGEGLLGGMPARHPIRERYAR